MYIIMADPGILEGGLLNILVMAVLCICWECYVCIHYSDVSRNSEGVFTGRSQMQGSGGVAPSH